MYTIRQISTSMFVSLIVLSFLLLNASLISMDGDQDSGNQQDLVAGSQYEIKQNYPFAQPGYVDGQLRDPYIFISSVAKRLNDMDKYIEKSLSVLTEDEHDDSIKARMKTIMSVTRLARLDIGRIQSDIKNFFEIIKSGEDSEEKCKFVDLPGAWYGSNLTGKQIGEKQTSSVANSTVANSTEEAKNPVTPGVASTEAQLSSQQPQSEQVVAQQPQQRQDGGVQIGCGYHLPTCSCANPICIANRRSALPRAQQPQQPPQAQQSNRYVTRGAVTHDTWKCSCETCSKNKR